ncbi:hypothetical protein BJY04DRAFT_175763 [Aspergillus karnatakaensis]|uniref:uncharacterized protein n=1 Tax=Aspergillus karnatakaensis TaxID=1810916 RepID=UPI003CCC8FAA
MPHSSPMYQQLPSQDYQSSVNAAMMASAIQSERRSRPISWHPASRQPEYSVPQHYYPANADTNSQMFSVAHAGPQPMQAMANTFDDGSMLQSYAPFDISTLQHNFAPTAENQLPIQRSSFLQANDPQFDGVSWEGSTPGLTPSFVQPTSNSWPFDMVSMNQSVPSVGAPASNYGSVSSPGRMTEPVTPDFLPIQHFGDDLDSQSMPILEKADPEDELVGMGLYNNPDSLTEGSLYGLNGKGLKLEETFTPSPENEADEDDAEDDDDQGPIPERASESHQQPNSHYDASQQTNNASGMMMQNSFFFEDDEDVQQRGMVETQPPFSVGATPCMNYGYGWI